MLQICMGQSTDQITFGGCNVDDVIRFTYLSSLLMFDGDAQAEVNLLIDKAVSVFQHNGTNMDVVCDQCY